MASYTQHHRTIVRARRITPTDPAVALREGHFDVGRPLAGSDAQDESIDWLQRKGIKAKKADGFVRYISGEHVHRMGYDGTYSALQCFSSSDLRDQAAIGQDHEVRLGRYEIFTNGCVIRHIVASDLLEDEIKTLAQSLIDGRNGKGASFIPPQTLNRTAGSW